MLRHIPSRRILATGESAGGWRRAVLDRRAVDTWVIRAVWHTLHQGFPLRADDRLLDDLGMDDVDFDVDWEWIARQCGRSLEHADENPCCWTK